MACTLTICGIWDHSHSTGFHIGPFTIHYRAGTLLRISRSTKPASPVQPRKQTGHPVRGERTAQNSGLRVQSALDASKHAKSGYKLDIPYDLHAG